MIAWLSLRNWGAVLFVVVALASESPAFAQDYSSKPVRLIVSYPPGGPSDLVGRLLAAELRTALGQSVVVENQAGASGLIALEALAKAVPDGHTLSMPGKPAMRSTMPAAPSTAIACGRTSTAGAGSSARRASSVSKQPFRNTNRDTACH